ncbi:hypothetical protein ADK53_35975 [Streptomyces sp. WM6373]|uniref:hypothetical protein n=1 Tax=Streptomyces TaxID=1883 RepID=UPI0006AF671C|nr:hypothetical protein [Streptomyces sp. WM6373]KOU27714.1 hypothetical protein ADK53_35975 [Streptomyces sp. WM6373]
MRLGTTAAVFVGALALALPTAGPAPADDHGDRLGTLNYRYFDDAGRERQGRIRPADDGTCYLLTGTSRRDPAVEVTNRTRSRALLFDNPGCGGRAVATLGPNGSVSDVEVVAAFFKPADEAGQGPGRGDWNDGGDQEEGRGDWGDGGEQGQGRGDQNDEDAAGEDDQGRGDWSDGGQGQGRGEPNDAQDVEDVEDVEDVDAAQEDFVSMVLRAIG